MTATIKLTTLVACETDEQIGNDSYVGALAIVEQPSYYQFAQLVDLGAGRTGIIIDVNYGETTVIELAEYRDGLDTQRMRVRQSLSAGE